MLNELIAAQSRSRQKVGVRYRCLNALCTSSAGFFSLFKEVELFAAVVMLTEPMSF